MDSNILSIKNLNVSIGDKEILKDVTITVKSGENVRVHYDFV